MLSGDLIGLIVSYLDVTDYFPEERIALISALGSNNNDTVLSVWWKNSLCESKIFLNRIFEKVNGNLHCEDGPALQHNETKTWYWKGQKHRTDGPALERSNGDKEWWVNGVRHRTDGPAVEWANGDKHWLLNGKLHRTDGPAVEWANGDKEWWLNGDLHREDGRVIESVGGQ